MHEIPCVSRSVAQGLGGLHTPGSDAPVESGLCSACAQSQEQGTVVGLASSEGSLARRGVRGARG